MGIIINAAVPVISGGVMKDRAGIEYQKTIPWRRVPRTLKINHTSIMQFAYSYSDHSYFSDVTLVVIVTASG